MYLLPGIPSPHSSLTEYIADLSLETSAHDPLVKFLTAKELSKYYDRSMDQDEKNVLGRGSFGAVFKGIPQSRFFKSHNVN